MAVAEKAVAEMVETQVGRIVVPAVPMAVAEMVETQVLVQVTVVLVQVALELVLVQVTVVLVLVALVQVLVQVTVVLVVQVQVLVAGRKRKTLILNARRLVKQRTPARTVTQRVDPALLRLEAMSAALIKVLSRLVPRKVSSGWTRSMPPTFTAQWKRDSPKINRAQIAWRLGTAFLTLNSQVELTRIWQKPSCTRHAMIEEKRFHKLCWITAEVMRTHFITTSA